MAQVWDVYTVGDVSFVHEIFLGVSHIFYGTGQNVFLQVYMIGMLLGVVWIIVEAMIQQKPIALGSLFVAFILYSALFVPHATVHLEDGQTKKFYTMDKIPLGLAVGVSVVSKIGMGLTRTFEDFFTPVGGPGAGCSPTHMTCTGYLGSLNKIIELRNNLSSRPFFMEMNKVLCGVASAETGETSICSEQVSCNLEMTISNYVRDCAINKFIANPAMLNSVRNFEDFRSMNMSYSTETYLTSQGGKTQSCYEAFNAINNAIESNKAKIAELGLKSEWIIETPHGHQGGGDATSWMAMGAGVNYNTFADILGNLSGNSDNPNAYTYMINVMLRNPISQGLEKGFTSIGDRNAALMIKTARDQRNIQWSSEENMWVSTAKAMANFFEGFVVSLVCLIPFVMFLGGLNLMVEYLKVLLWVQLWNPVMCICNLYIQTVASQKVKDAIASSPITDMYVIDSVDEVVQHWIAVGGLMAATTPLLALFVLKGSVYTFTTLASKMSGGDHVNEKAVSPDGIQNAPLLANSVGAYSNDNFKNIRGVGTDSAYKTITGNAIKASMISSADQAMQNESNNYVKSVSNALEHISSAGKLQNFVESYIDKRGGLKNIVTSEGWKVAEDIALKSGRQNDLAFKKEAYAGYELSATAGLDVSASVNAVNSNENQITNNGLKKSPSIVKSGRGFGRGFLLGAGANGSLSKGEKISNNRSYTQGSGETDTQQEGYSNDYRDSIAINHDVAKALNSAVQDTLQNSDGKKISGAVNDSYSKVKSSTKSYEQTDSISNQVNVLTMGDSGQIMQMRISDSAFKKFINTHYDPLLSEILNKEDGKTGTELYKQKARALEYFISFDGAKTDTGIAFWQNFGNLLSDFFQTSDPHKYDYLEKQKINTTPDGYNETLAKVNRSIEENKNELTTKSYNNERKVEDEQSTLDIQNTYNQSQNAPVLLQLPLNEHDDAKANQRPIENIVSDIVNAISFVPNNSNNKNKQ